MYDAFSADYDRFVNWPARLAIELPFIEQQLQTITARRVLDTACGTGMHAIALAQRGYVVVGADLSAGMVERARTNAATAGVKVRFEAAGFGGLKMRLGGDFDALFCLGNSLPHLLTPADLTAALADFAACLRPGGLVLIQNRNFDAVLAQHDQQPESNEGRWQEPQYYREDDTEWLFLRFYDFEPDGLLAFNIATLQHSSPEEETWTQRVTTTRLWPLRQAELTRTLSVAGFGAITCYGNMSGAAFAPDISGNLVVTAISNPR